MLPGVKIFVMDVEGVDSAERWEEGAVRRLLEILLTWYSFSRKALLCFH